MNELRAIVPKRIIRGALLRHDGSAVGLVCGGAPRWDLLALAARAQVGSDYHRFLLVLEGPLDIYLVDQPPEVTNELARFIERQAHISHTLQAAVLGEMTDYLSELAEARSSRTKQVIWAIGGTGGGPRGIGSLDVRTMLPHKQTPQRPTTSNRTALATAVEKARRLADALGQIGGTPPPRLMEPEEIAHLFYQLADPVRAERYPLAGTLLERVRHIVTVSNEKE